MAQASIDQYQDRSEFCLLKLYFRNAYNECNRPQTVFLDQVAQYFPDIYNWVQWCYCAEAELRFGINQLVATTGVQQGDPLGPLLLSLTLFLEANLHLCIQGGICRGGGGGGEDWPS